MASLEEIIHDYIVSQCLAIHCITREDSGVYPFRDPNRWRIQNDVTLCTCQASFVALRSKFPVLTTEGKLYFILHKFGLVVSTLNLSTIFHLNNLEGFIPMFNVSLNEQISFNLSKKSLTSLAFSYHPFLSICFIDVFQYKFQMFSIN